MPNLSIYGRNAWEGKRKSEKAFLLTKLLLVLLFTKCYLKTKMIKTDPIIFIVKKFCGRDFASFSVFW